MFEDTKGVIKSHQRTENAMTKKNKKQGQNDLQNMTQIEQHVPH
jgi:hypothetical protein